MRIKKGLKNIISGFFRQGVMLILGLILPRLILVSYGSEINGFISSITQIITYLSLLEVGVGTATLQALYHPISIDNKKQINSIMSATHIYYRRTAKIYTFLVFIFAIFYPVIVQVNLSYINTVFFILVSGMTGVLTYLFQGKYKILLQSEGKNYIIINLSTFVSIATNVLKIILIQLNVNILILQLVYLVFNIIQTIILYFYTRKQYSWLDLREVPDFEAISQSKSVMIHEISYIIFNYTDTLILTLMCNLETVSVYSIYSVILGQIENVILTFSTSFQFMLGEIYSKSIDKYKKVYNIFESGYLVISFTFFTIALLFIELFINLYTKEINDINYNIPFFAEIFIVVKLLTCLRTLMNQTILVGGHFDQTKKIAVYECFINLIISIIFVKIFGIYGVLIGTIMGLVFRITFTLIYVNSKVLRRSNIILLKRLGVNSVLLLIIKHFYQHFIISRIVIENYVELVLIAGMTTLILLMIFSLVSVFTELSLLKDIVKYVKDFLEKRKDEKGEI